MRNYTTVLLGFLLLIHSSVTVDAIRCYGHNLKTFALCRGPVNDPPLDKCEKVPCDPGYEQYCVRITGDGSGYEAADYTMLPGCVNMQIASEELKKEVREAKCTTRGKGSYTVTTCYCNTDLCNGT